MNDTKREELEKACKKEKDHKVRTKMVAVRMVRVLNMSADETADIRVHCPTWVSNWLHRYDKAAWKASGIFPAAAGPEESRAASWMTWSQTWQAFVSLPWICNSTYGNRRARICTSRTSERSCTSTICPQRWHKRSTSTGQAGRQSGTRGTISNDGFRAWKGLDLS